MSLLQGWSGPHQDSSSRSTAVPATGPHLVEVMYLSGLEQIVDRRAGNKKPQAFSHCGQPGSKMYWYEILPQPPVTGAKTTWCRT